MIKKNKIFNKSSIFFKKIDKLKKKKPDSHSLVNA